MTLVTTSSDAAVRTRSRLVLIASSLGILFAQIDTSVVNLAVKSIDADLHAGVSAMQWVIDSYNLVYASLLLTGGTQVISGAVESALSGMGIAVERVSGGTRYDTAVTLANLAVSRYGFAPGHAELATGDSFPDALAAGSHMGTRRSVLLLTPHRDLPGVVATFLRAHHPGADSHVLGGPVAIDPLAKQEAEEAVDGL